VGGEGRGLAAGIASAVYLEPFRKALPVLVVAVPIGCRAYCTLRTGFGVALRLNDPAVLRTGCIARRTGLGNSPRRKLTCPLPS
jgi:hypothetical protein